MVYYQVDPHSSVDKQSVKKVVCLIESHNERAHIDFEHYYEKYGKKDNDLMCKEEITEFIKFMHGFNTETTESNEANISVC